MTDYQFTMAQLKLLKGRDISSLTAEERLEIANISPPRGAWDSKQLSLESGPRHESTYGGATPVLNLAAIQKDNLSADRRLALQEALECTELWRRELEFLPHNRTVSRRQLEQAVVLLKPYVAS